MTSEPKGHDGDDPERGGQGGGGGSFEDRLRAARSRHGLERRENAGPSLSSGGAEGPSPMSVGLRVGVELVSAMVVAVAIGIGLDRWLHTSPALLVVFVLLGGAAGIANVWRVMGPKAPRR